MSANPLHSKAMRNGLYRKAHPIAAAMARKAMASDLLEVGLGCHLADHGSEQPEMLGTLAYLIGMGAEVAGTIPVDGRNRPALHQALQAVVDMACDGRRWDASWAAQLHLAADISIDLFCSYKNLASRCEPSARQLSEEVKAGTVRRDVLKPLLIGAY